MVPKYLTAVPSQLNFETLIINEIKNITKAPQDERANEKRYKN